MSRVFPISIETPAMPPAPKTNATSERMKNAIADRTIRTTFVNLRTFDFLQYAPSIAQYVVGQTKPILFVSFIDSKKQINSQQPSSVLFDLK